MKKLQTLKFFAKKSGFDRIIIANQLNFNFMLVSDIMTKEVITVGEETPLKDAAGLLAKFRIHGMPVVNEENKVEGIITESDFFMKDSSNIYLPTFLDFISRGQNPESKDKATSDMEKITTVKDIMTVSCVCVNPEMSLKEMINLIKEKNFKTLPVINNTGTLIGIVTIYDIIRLL
jgi:CBS domain-containing protein